MKKLPKSRVHAFLGEDLAAVVIEWLAGDRSKPDVVEGLIELSASAHLPGKSQEIFELIRDVVRDWQFGSAPSVGIDPASPYGVRVVDRLLTNPAQVQPLQALAFWRALDLLKLGLLDRVRRCATEGCAKWFFARYPIHIHCCEEHRIRSLNSSERRKADRAAWMRGHRRTQKLLAEAKKKRKKGGK
jgi:hypothetical protein